MQNLDYELFRTTEKFIAEMVKAPEGVYRKVENTVTELCESREWCREYMAATFRIIKRKRQAMRKAVLSNEG